MEDDDNDKLIISSVESTDFSFDDGNYVSAGTAGSDTITITLPDDLTTISLTDPYGNTMNSGGYGGSISSAAGISGQVLTSNSISGSTNWTSASSVFTIGEIASSASLQLSGENPRIKTDTSEINLDDLAKVMDVVKDIVDLNQIEIFDKAFRDKHEILQKSWEDIKTAYENYRITEALLKSTPPGEDND